MNYVISDIHGCFYTLRKLVDKIRIKDDSAQLIFIGDYIDRGLHSKDCVEFVIKLQKEGAICLRGNHDDVIDWIVNNDSFTDLQEMIVHTKNLVNIGTWWMQNGFFYTIDSYINVRDSKVSIKEQLDYFINFVPEDHKIFFHELRIFWENDTHFALHAYLNPRMVLPRSLRFLPHSIDTDLLWARFPVGNPVGLGCDKPVWDKIGIFGHTPVDIYGSVVPIKFGNLRLIDTGAFMDGYLAAYICEQDNWILQATDSRDIAQ